MRITELLFYSFIYFLLLSQLSKTAPFPPLDAIIVQIQHSGVVGGSYVAKQVLFNGLPLSNTSREVSHILQSLSTKELFPFNRSISQIPALKDHTIVCHQECVLESHRLQWSEHVFYDGEVYLRLEPNGTWTALVPQAVLLKGLLEQTGRHGGSERTRLQNGCMQLMKELRLPDKPSGSGIVSTRILIPVLGVVAFAGLITVSILVSKNRGKLCFLFFLFLNLLLWFINGTSQSRKVPFLQQFRVCYSAFIVFLQPASSHDYLNRVFTTRKCKAASCVCLYLLSV
ncbi:uncharacterized protein si:dkeyp-13a3.10 isoform X2 [Oryzias melastigma]|uniref:uncharacterized protein si:dkeyp-13a3.10 isoform X2 n=1 Tax=Oryzias melastigma TaxID=30732 RepID=UPI00168CBC1F|nr:uncharacterized protein si:dkeyp-13a3.10 isoform X2 [Oryzias melastigma]